MQLVLITGKTKIAEIGNRMGGRNGRWRGWRNRHSGQNCRVGNREIGRRHRRHHLEAAEQRQLLRRQLRWIGWCCCRCCHWAAIRVPGRSVRGRCSGPIEFITGAENRDLRGDRGRRGHGGRRRRDVGADLARRRRVRSGKRRWRTRRRSRTELTLKPGMGRCWRWRHRPDHRRRHHWRHHWHHSRHGVWRLRHGWWRWRRYRVIWFWIRWDSLS